MHRLYGTTRDVASIITAKLTPLDKNMLAKSAEILCDLTLDNAQIIMYAVSHSIEACIQVLNTIFIFRPRAGIENMFNTACQLGKYKRVRQLETIYGRQIPDNLCINAAIGGNLKLLLYLLRDVLDRDYSLKKCWRKAAEYGHIDCIDYIYKYYYRESYNYTPIEPYAIRYGYIDFFEWMLKNNIPLKNNIQRNNNSIVSQMQYIQTTTLDWLLNHGWEYNEGIAYAATQYNRFDILTYLNDKGYIRWVQSSNKS